MAHKVMSPPFTSEQLEMIEGMIEKAISDHDDTLDWNSDIEDAVQSAQSDVQATEVDMRNPRDQKSAEGYWKYLDENSRIVSEWPEWLKGVRPSPGEISEAQDADVERGNS